MSRNIQVLNSPWGHAGERPSDCQRWISRGDMVTRAGSLWFTDKFLASVIRAAVECDPVGFDDGIPRRWVARDMARQLRPLAEVGTARSVTPNPDRLRRRQTRRGPVIRIYNI